MPRERVYSSDDYDERPDFERIGAPRGRVGGKWQNQPAPAPETATESAFPLEVLEPFFEKNWISEVLHVVKSGKEATVYCCRAHPDTELDLVAAKVYRSRDDRSFKNDAVYQEGRVILDSRLRRAVAGKTRVGREAQFADWVAHEYETLRRIYGAGAQVPVPFATAGSAILMEYLGGEHQPAPVLNSVELERHEVRPLFDLVLANIELLLSCGRVHGDLSPFNILYWNGRVRIIDFPQAVDPEVNGNAYKLLQRDVENVCRYWARYGVRANAERLAAEIWNRSIYAV